MTITYLGTLATDCDKVRFCLDVAPVPSVDNEPDIGSASLESAGYLAHGQLCACMQTSDLKHLVFGQPGHWMVLADEVAAKCRDRVLHIGNGGDPFKIACSIVARYTVLVIRFVSIRTRAMKRLCNNTMKRICMGTTVLGENYADIRAVALIGLQNPSRHRAPSPGDALDAPKAANLIDQVAQGPPHLSRHQRGGHHSR